jgi:hypothetical protein
MDDVVIGQTVIANPALIGRPELLAFTGRLPRLTRLRPMRTRSGNTVPAWCRAEVISTDDSDECSDYHAEYIESWFQPASRDDAGIGELETAQRWRRLWRPSGPGPRADACADACAGMRAVA